MKPFRPTFAMQQIKHLSLLTIWAVILFFAVILSVFLHEDGHGVGAVIDGIQTPASQLSASHHDRAQEWSARRAVPEYICIGGHLYLSSGCRTSHWSSTATVPATGAEEIILFSVTASDDGQMLAFTRRSWVGDVLDGYEQFALWAMNRAGGNPRELISAQELRQWLNPSKRDSSNFYQFSWIPQSHQLIFSGTKYIVQAEGLSHAIPHGVYLVDTDKGSVTVLAEAAENLRFLPSPDGKQIALMSPSDVGFINVDGSNKRQDVLTYAEVGLTAPLFPTGVWTQDSHAFVMTGSFESDPNFDVNFTIWRISIDDFSAEALGAVTGSNPNSVTFSPDGKRASLLQTTEQQPSEIAGWFIKPLIPEAGPLALPYYGKKAFYANLHWSPAGDAFAIKDQDLLQLCPNATQDSQVCGEPIHLGGGIITTLQWVDSSRFLFESIEPNTLSLGNLDGTITPIVTWTELQRWTENDVLSGWSFWAAQ